jgi:hypothetical protein
MRPLKKRVLCRFTEMSLAALRGPADLDAIDLKIDGLVLIGIPVVYKFQSQCLQRTSREARKLGRLLMVSQISVLLLLDIDDAIIRCTPRLRQLGCIVSKMQKENALKWWDLQQYPRVAECRAVRTLLATWFACMYVQPSQWSLQHSTCMLVSTLERRSPLK